MKAWLQLIRVSGLFSLASNALAAVAVAVYAYSLAYDLLAAELIRHWPQALGITIASIASYCAGMIWNDVADLWRDKEIAPLRPLPSGKISLTQAVLAGIAMTTIALLAASLTGIRGGLGFGLLMALILAYNFSLKQIPYLGSFCMALIRGCHAVLILLVLGDAYFDRTVLGLAYWLNPVASAALKDIGVLVPWYAFMLTTYIFGLTLISELADRPARRLECVGGAAAWMVAWLTAFGLAWQSHWLLELWHQQQFMILGCAAFVIIAAWVAVVMHNLRAWWRLARLGERQFVGPVVRRGLIGIVFFDAFIALAFHPAIALAILSLLIPFLLSLRLVRMD